MDMITPIQTVLSMVLSLNPEADVDYADTIVTHPVPTTDYQRNTVARITPRDPSHRGHYREVWYDRTHLEESLVVPMPVSLSSYGLVDALSNHLGVQLSPEDVVYEEYISSDPTTTLKISPECVLYTGSVEVQFIPNLASAVRRTSLNGFYPYKLAEHITKDKLVGFSTNVLADDVTQSKLNGYYPYVLTDHIHRKQLRGFHDQSMDRDVTVTNLNGFM